jgi:hypothetical protein
MTRIILITLLTLLFVPNSFAASHHNRSSSASTSSFSTEEHPFGLGVVIGEPTAITAKYWLDGKHSIDGGLGAFFGSYTLLYADYLFSYPGAFGHQSAFVSQLTPYFGAGPVLAFTTSSYDNNNNLRGKNSGDIGLGVRVPGGIEWRPNDPTIGVYVELAPGISIMPQVGIFLQAGIGIRYYF